MKMILEIKAILFVIITGILGVIGIISIFLTAHANPNVTNMLTAVLLYLTFLVLIWYTWETRQLKIETRRLRKWAAADNQILKKQSITDVRPYLRLQRGNTYYFLQLVNEGKGIAVNLEPVYVKGRKQVTLLRIPAMAAAPDSNTTSFVSRDIFPEPEVLNPETQKYMVRVKYEDIEGRKYEAVFQSDASYNDKFSIISQEEITQRHSS